MRNRERPQRRGNRDCTMPSTGMIPLTMLGCTQYLDAYEGGLYPRGSNELPDDHEAEGIRRAKAIGESTGKVVFLSLGFSNASQEFCSQDSFLPCNDWSFMGQAAVETGVDHRRLSIVNGAMPGQGAKKWSGPERKNYDRVRDDKLLPRRLTEKDVRAVWMKMANPRPAVSLPNADADAHELSRYLGDIVRAVGERYQNCELIFLSSRTYGGWSNSPLNPEPYAYESAFAVKWLIEAQIKQMRREGQTRPFGDLDCAYMPHLSWGPYLWADGNTKRTDGLFWECEDTEQRDGVHPSPSGEEIAAQELLRFLLESPLAIPWFGK